MTLKLFFSPAITLMNRLGYPRKFVLLGFISLTSTVVAMSGLFSHLDKDIRDSELGLQGLALIQPLSHTVQLVQQCRGLSAALLGGDEAMRNRYLSKERETEEALEVLEKKLPSRLISSGDWRMIKAGLERLHKDGLGMPKEENFIAHTRLIEQLLIFEATLSDEYLLTINPDTDIGTFYLIDTIINKLPYALEDIGQIRAYGTGILARKEASEFQKINMNTLIYHLGDTLKFLKGNLRKTGHYKQALQDQLAATSNNIDGAAQHIDDLVRSDIITGRFTTPALDFLEITTLAIDSSYSQMYESLIPAAGMLINERIDSAWNTLYLSIGIALVLVIVVTYFAMGIYFSIIDSVRTLAKSAHVFAGGGLQERVNLNTHDELNQVGSSFNEMADGFCTLLARHEQTEASLARENYINETLLRTACDSIYIFDINGDVVQVNDAFCRMLGYTHEEMMAMNVAQWNAQWSAAELKEILANLKFSNPIFETRHRCKDGSIIDVEISAAKVTIDGRQLIYNATRNISERKLAERALRESEEKYRTLAEAAGDAIFVIDRDLRYEYVNSRAAKELGANAEDIVGRSMDEFFSPQKAEAYRHEIDKMFEMGGSHYQEVEVEFLQASAWRGILFTAIGDREGRRRAVMGIARDITERKHLEEELQSHRKEMRVLLNRQVAAQTAAAFAHKLNQPLSAISTYSAAALMMLEGGDHDSEKLHLAIKESERQAQRAGQTIRQMIQFLSIGEFSSSIFNLNKEIQDVLAMVQSEREIRFNAVLKLDKDVRPVRANRSHIQKVLENLLNNSIDAMEGAEMIQPSVTITTHATEDEDMAQVTIQDSGPGMTAENFQQVFEPFFTTKASGIGMGLAISRSLIEANGGKIWIDPHEGHGAIFHFTLPFAA